MPQNTNFGAKLLVLSGPIGAGKSSVALAVAEITGALVIRTRELILSRMPQISKTRDAFQIAGDHLDDLSGHGWLSDEMGKVVSSKEFTAKLFVLDSVRTKRQLASLRHSKNFRIFHVHLFASEDELRTRFEARRDVLDTSARYVDLKNNRHEREIGELAHEADIVMDTGYVSPSNLAAQIVGKAWPKVLSRAKETID